jgi:hypothetical protein
MSIEPEENHSNATLAQKETGAGLEFPYEKVYEFFARGLTGTIVKENPFAAMFYGVAIVDGEVNTNGGMSIQDYFSSAAGQAAFGEELREMLPSLTPRFGLVVIAESWIKMTDLEGARRRDRTRSLEHDPDAIEALVIMIYGPGGEMRKGTLPISRGREVAYQAIEAAGGLSGGRLSPNPHSNPVDVVDTAAAAIRKAQKKS